MAARVLAIHADEIGDAPLAGMALSWIDHDVQPRVIVDDYLAVLWANAAARAALARRMDLENRAGQLQATNWSYQEALRDFILRSSAAVTSWHMPRENGDGCLLFRAQRIQWHDETAAYGITFFGSGSDFTPRYADLDSVFHLTRTEHRVLLDLLQGHDAATLSELQGISVETVRTHVRRIYDKMSVRSREEMCRRAAPFRL